MGAYPCKIAQVSGCPVCLKVGCIYIYIHIFQMDIFMFKIYGIVMNQTPGISWNYKSLDSLVDTVLSNKSFEK